MTIIERLKPFFQWLAGTDAFMKVGPKIVPAMDRLVHKVTRGRPISDKMIPTLVLTTTGAKTGQARQTPLACLPEPGGAFLIVGSNFGRDHHPAWSGNLLRTPEAVVSFRGTRVAVVARLLEGEERERVWPGLVAQWPVYDRYTVKSGRHLRVFRLTPVD